MGNNLLMSNPSLMDNNGDEGIILGKILLIEFIREYMNRIQTEIIANAIMGYLKNRFYNYVGLWFKKPTPAVRLFKKK